MKLRIFLLTLFMSVLTLCASDAWSAEKQVHKQGNKKVTSSKQAAKIVQKQYGGRVLKVNKQKNNAGYRVKIVKPNGQVISKKVNAKTGKIENN
ncbi:hypothetical protein CMT41_05285 [Colwellia sp. MT41]|uniref:PepSY domain-containing protein n=1 Tax=Colwellia sp. MT41 TaxID=58049 RepID=UPI000717974C|nr:PepSY domain-containing protein [Colwellia sp. MT41]ALO34207.1 hypothetical protein CMT41_05285 [Colwellia sp. MT41]